MSGFLFLLLFLSSGKKARDKGGMKEVCRTEGNCFI